MEVCLINFNKGEDDEGCLKFCNILKWSAIVRAKNGKFWTVCLYAKYNKQTKTNEHIQD